MNKFPSITSLEDLPPPLVAPPTLRHLSLRHHGDLHLQQFVHLSLLTSLSIVCTNSFSVLRGLILSNPSITSLTLVSSSPRDVELLFAEPLRMPALRSLTLLAPPPLLSLDFTFVNCFSAFLLAHCSQLTSLTFDGPNVSEALYDELRAMSFPQLRQASFLGISSSLSYGAFLWLYLRSQFISHSPLLTALGLTFAESGNIAEQLASKMKLLTQLDLTHLDFTLDNMEADYKATASLTRLVGLRLPKTRALERFKSLVKVTELHIAHNLTFGDFISQAPFRQLTALIVHSEQHLIDLCFLLVAVKKVYSHLQLISFTLDKVPDKESSRLLSDFKAVECCSSLQRVVLRAKQVPTWLYETTRKVLWIEVVIEIITQQQP